MSLDPPGGYRAGDNPVEQITKALPSSPRREHISRPYPMPKSKESPGWEPTWAGSWKRASLRLEVIRS
jgi:hypothetical protein